jgi:hypothetical protein
MRFRAFCFKRVTMRSSILLVSLTCVRIAPAQTPITPQLGDRSVDAWMGFSPISHVGDLNTPTRQVLLLGVGAEWVVETLGPVALAATSDVVPLALVTHNPTYITHHITLPLGGTLDVNEPTGEKPVFGAGVTPFGFKLYVRSSRNVRFYGAGAVGGLWFTRDMPVPDARRFNVSFEYGGGLEFLHASGGALVLGYKFHHLSNSNSAAENPGLDSHVFYFGMSRAR